MKATIYPIVAAAPNRVAIAARPRGGDWLRDELGALSREGIDVLVSMLTEEESKELGLESECEDCEAVAIKFVNLPIPDRSVPSDNDDFLRSVERLAEMVGDGRSLAVHCRASIGRSSVLAASVLADLGGTPMKPSAPLNRHAAARSRIHPSSASGSSRTFRQRGDASLLIDLSVLAFVQQAAPSSACNGFSVRTEPFWGISLRAAGRHQFVSRGFENRQLAEIIVVSPANSA